MPMVMVEFGTSSAFREWVRVRGYGYGFGVRGRKVKSRDCALASDLVRASSASFEPRAGRVSPRQFIRSDLKSLEGARGVQRFVS